jgi:hypothetical protein
MYSYEHDKRKPEKMEKYKDKDLCIVVWNQEKMKGCVENKFNQKGFFICKKNKKKEYEKICFGSTIDYISFLENVKLNRIYLDSGMYHDDNKSNDRLYSLWRADSSFWTNLLVEEF